MGFFLVSFFDAYAFHEYYFTELQLHWSVNVVVMLVLISNDLGLSSLLLLLLIYAHISIIKLKIKLYIRQELMYSADCWTVRKKEEQILEKTDMIML